MASAPTRHQAIARTLWVVLLLNLGVSATKLVVGYRIDALALIADGIHSLLDASSNVVGLIGITLASRPPDHQHPYGHQRFETLAAVGIGLLIGAGLVEIVHQIVEQIAGEPAVPTVTLAAVLAVVATVLINLAISRFEGHRARELQSSLLEADSRHTLSDAMAAMAVLAGFAGSELGVPFADPLAATIVALFIAKTAWAILKSNVGVLADEVRLAPERVYEVALSVAGVRGAHKIRSRGAIDSVHVDLHIHLDPSLPLTEAHGKTHEVERALRTAFPEVADVVIHTEPADGREQDTSSLAPG